jgi:4'-phosphopantetheinyl transferase
LETIFFNNLNDYSGLELKQNDNFILYKSFETYLNQKTWDDYLALLPINLQEDVLKYRNKEDRYNSLFGKMLVYSFYYLLYDKPLDFCSFARTSFNKPYLKDSDLYFNISHSGNMVACVFSRQPIGLDIEQVKKIDINAFESVFSKAEMQKIREGGDKKFYELWTIKEAVAKAIGKGLDINLLAIEILQNQAIYNSLSWQIRSFVLNEMYCAVSAKKLNNTKIIKIEF